MNAVLDQKVLRFSLSSELVDQINTLAMFRGIENGKFWGIMGPLMDIKLFNTNLIRFVLIFNRINMNGIMIKSFSEVS